MSDPDDGKLQWSEPRLVNTRRGDRMLQTATPTERFWEGWKNNKQAILDRGIQVKKDNGKWVVLWWRPIDQEEVRENIEASRAESTNLVIHVPDGLEYMPFQGGAIEYASERWGTLLGLEKGLGKTIVSIGVINLKPEIKRILVVCPATLKLNWRNELNKWLVRDHDIVIVPDGKTWIEPFDSPVMVTIINYDLLGKHLKRLHEREWDLVIADEVQYIKGKATLRKKALLGGGQGKGKKKTSPIPSKKFLALSGTPIPNRVMEIWNIAHHLAPQEFPNYWQFGNRFCGAKAGWGGKMDFTGASNLPELQQKLRGSCMYRVKKEDVLKDLPDKVKQIIEMPPSNDLRRELDEEKRLYKLHKDTIDELRIRRKMAEINDDPKAFAESAEKLKGGISVAFAEMAKVRAKIAELKAPYVVQQITDMVENVEKVIVFCWHRKLLAEIIAGMDKIGVETVQLHGGTKMSERQEAVERFQNGSARVFAGNMVAAGTGITLTASSNIIMAEMDWTPGNMSQAEDRAHRIGQEESVLIQYLIMEDSLDSTMINRVIDKQSNIDAALDDDHGLVETITIDPPELELGNGDALPKKRKTPYSEIGRGMTLDEREMARTCLQRLVSLDSDRATVVNGAGFSKVDGKIGHELATCTPWTDGQAGFAKHLATKYRRQLPENMIAILIKKD